MTPLEKLNRRLSVAPIEAQRKFVMETIAHLAPQVSAVADHVSVVSTDDDAAALALADWPMPEGVDPERWLGAPPRGMFEPGGYGEAGLRPGETVVRLSQPYPDGNPKTAIGATKLPLDLVPPSAMQYLALAFKDGGAKYGPFNWRDAAVSSTVYYAAALRHLFAWFDGEDKAEDSGVHHLAHVMACCAIILDCEKLNDNRPTPGVAAQMQKEYKA